MSSLACLSLLGTNIIASEALPWTGKSEHEALLRQKLIPLLLLKAWEKYRNKLSVGISPLGLAIRDEKFNLEDTVGAFSQWENNNVPQSKGLVEHNNYITHKEANLKSQG